MDDRPEDIENGPEDIETGAPVEELADLVQAPRPGFAARVRRVIYRRTLISQTADLSWQVPLMVLLEYLNVILSALRPRDPRVR